MSRTDRLAYIDNIKGIGIFLVVLGHTTKNVHVINFIYSFHIPLFFFISGMFINPNKYTLKDFVINKFKRLIVPYFIFCAISLAIWSSAKLMMGEHINILEQILGIFRANVNLGDLKFNIPLWFLPCLFVTEVFIVLNLKSTQNKKSFFFTIFTIVILGVLFNKKTHTHLPWGFEITIFQILFTYFGYISKKYLSISFSKKHFNLFATIILLTISIFIIQLYGVNINGRVDVSSNIYGNIIIFLINSTLGIINTLLICKLIPNKPICIITNTGYNSLIVMSSHIIIILFINNIMKIHFTESITASIISTLIILTIYNYIISKKYLLKKHIKI